MAWVGTSWGLTSGGQIGPHGASKHARQIYDEVREYTVLTGGDRDGSGAGQPNIYRFIANSGAGPVVPFLVMPTTGSTGSPAYSPAYPDNCTWIYSSVLDVYAIARSFWFKSTFAMGQQPLRSTADWHDEACIYNPSSSSKFGIPGRCYSSFNIPTPDPFWGGDSNSNFGAYDPVTNAMTRLIWDGAWGCTMQIIPLGDLNTFPQATKVSCGSGHPSGSSIRNWVRNLDPHARQQAIDWVGRKLYTIGQSAGGLDSTADHGYGLLRVDLNNPTLGERLRLPTIVPSSRRGDPAIPGEVVFRPQIDPFSTVPFSGGVDYILCYDTIRRQIMFPQIIGYGGEVYNTLIYDIATSQWSVVDSNSIGATTTGPWPVGNVFSYDPVEGCGVLTGGHGNTSPMINHPTITVQTTIPSHVFRVTPGNSTSVQSTGSPNFVTAHVTALTGPVNVTSSITGGVYRFNAYDGATSSFIATVDSASANVKTADFTGLIIGKNYKFTGEHRTGSDTGVIGGSTGIVSRLATLSGVPISTSSASGADVNPPVITLIYPKSSDTVSGIISFQYAVTDTEGVARTELYLNNVLLPSPVWDSNTIASGSVPFWRVRAWDLSSNSAEEGTFFNVQNVSTPPPSPVSTSDGVRAIFLNPTVPGRVGYVLWSTVPAGEEIPRPGIRSAWPNLKDEERALLESGEVRERSGTMKIEGTDDQMKDRLIARWQEFDAEVQDLPDWTLENNFWNGTGWVAR